MLKKALLLIATFVFMMTSQAFAKSGMASVSYYAHAFHGKTQANGKPFNMHAMTTAHKSLPFGTKVRMTNIKNGKSVVVTVTDRGPYIAGRAFDLSMAAFKKIAPLGQGTAKVKYEILR